MSTYKFKATIKSFVKNGEVEFHIVPTSQYEIKSPDGVSHYVAFDETGGKVCLLEDDKLQHKMGAVTCEGVRPWLCVHADTGRSVEFEFKKSSEILKVTEAKK